MSILPIINLATFTEGGQEARNAVAAVVDAACRDTGFLLIEGHGVSAETLERMHWISAEFFAKPTVEKQRVAVPARADLGWKAQGGSYLAETLMPGGDVEKVEDWKESFGMGAVHRPTDISHQEQAFFEPNIFPESPAEMRETYEDYYGRMEQVAASILSVFGVALGIGDDYFEDKTNRHGSVLAVHNYPAQDTAPVPGQLRAGAHTDFGAITILHTGSNPGGLQVQDKDGKWQDVVPGYDQFVVNIGDLMAQWTNDRWVSTLHRVVNPASSRAHLARQSITFFHQPNWHAVIECLPNCAGSANPAKYAPVTSGAHLGLKLARLRGLAA